MLCRPIRPRWSTGYMPHYKTGYKGVRQKLDLNGVSIGQLSFVTAPYEVFSTSGMDIKNHGRELFSLTFVCSCSNGENKYIPVQRSFELDPERKTFEVGMCRFIPGTAEDLAQNFKEILTELKA